MNLFSNKIVWKHSPIVTTLLLEGSNVGHLLRMWRERTSAGQSLLSWIYVGIALMLWYNWYRLFAPTEKVARYTCLTGLMMNTAVIFTVVYFRYIVT